MATKQRFNIKSYTNPGGSAAWRVSGRMPDGRQIRKNYTDKAEASAVMAELNLRAGNMTPSVRLRRTRLTELELIEAEAVLHRLSLNPHKPSLTDILDYYEKHCQPDLAEIRLSAAIDEFLEDRVDLNLRERTIRDYRSRLGMFLEYCSDMFLEQVTVKEVRGYVRRPDLSPRGRNGRRRVLLTFFLWCRERSYCANNPVVSVSPSRTDQTVPHILALKEVGSLLRSAAELSSGSMLPFFVLSLFAGLRPKEAAGLSWQAIDLVTGNIHLDGKNAKLRQRRVISISDNLNSWLRSCINKPIQVPNFRKRFDQVRRHAGFSVGRNTSSDPAGMKPWHPDLMRHTSLTYHYGMSQDESKTAAWAGNSPDVFHRHYKGLVTSEDSQAFWSLRPGNVFV